MAVTRIDGGLSKGHYGERSDFLRKEIDNRPGMLASTLEPLAKAGADEQTISDVVLQELAGCFAVA